MSATETYTLSIVGSPINGPTIKRLILTQKKEDKKGKLTINNKILGEFDDDKLTQSLIEGKKDKVATIYKNLKANIEGAPRNSNLFYGIKPAGLAAIARSLDVSQEELKNIVIALTSDPRSENMIEEFRFTTRNAVRAMDNLAAGAGPTSFAGAFGPGGGGGAGISLSSTPFVRGTGNTEEDAITQSVVLAGVMIAGSALLPNSAMNGGKRKQSGGMPPRSRAGRSGPSVPSIPEEGAGGATVTNSGGAAVANVPLTEPEEAGGAAAASPASGRGGRPARRGASVAPDVTEATVSQIATGPPGGIGIAPTVIDTASAAAVATQVIAVTQAMEAGPSGHVPPPPGVPTVVNAPARTFQEVKNLLVGHLVEWMNANGTFVQNGRDLIMTKLYDFLSDPSTKSIIQTTAKATSVAAATLTVGSVGAAFVAPGAVLDIYLLMFSYITGAATAIIGSPLNIISNLIVKLLFYLPDSNKFEIFNQIVGQVGALGDNAGLKSLIKQLCPQAASLPGFDNGMFVADLAIGSYILLNLHRQMGAWSPFTLAGRVTQATFGPLIESVQGAALRVSTDVRLLATKLKTFTETIYGLSSSFYASDSFSAARTSIKSAIYPVLASAGRGIKSAPHVIYNGTSAVAGLGNTAFWLITSRGIEACVSCLSLFSAGSLLLKMPNAAVGFPIFTPTQQAAGAAIVSEVHRAAGVPENAANMALSDINSAAAATTASIVGPIAERIVNEAADLVLTIQDHTRRKRESETAANRGGGGGSAAGSGGGGGGGSAAGSGGGGGGAGTGGGGAAGTGLGGGRRRRRTKTHKKHHKRRVHRTKKHPKRR